MKVVTDGSESVVERIDAYLDGLLSPSDARATERMLAEPDVARVLAEALALREVLNDASDAPTPPGLADRIIGALGVGDEERAAEAGDGITAESSVGKVALFGASWMVRGPLVMLPSSADNDDRPAPKQAWWRPVLGLGRRR